jgi:hypothetical protein
MELCDYNYFPGRPVQERRLAIERALMDHISDTVIKQLKNIENYHPNIMIDISEIHEYLEDVLFLKDVLVVEKRYKEAKKARERLLTEYSGCLGRKRISFGENRESFRKINKK